MAITTCQESLEDWGDAAHGSLTWVPVGAPRCGKPLSPERWERGPWLCDDCLERTRRRHAQCSAVHCGWTPMVADALRVMQEQHLSQGDAVRWLLHQQGVADHCPQHL